MNKKQAIAYAQVTLNFMQSTQYKGKINPENFGIEMKQAFRLYPRDIVEEIANTQIAVEKDLENKE